MGNRHLVSYKAMGNLEEKYPNRPTPSLKHLVALTVPIKKGTAIYTTMRTGNNPTGAGTRRLFILRPYHKKEKD